LYTPIVKHPLPSPILPTAKFSQQGCKNPAPCENFSVFHHNDWDSGSKNIYTRKPTPEIVLEASIKIDDALF
jgi:hypothetical protein